jgi:hypothetical protein
MLSRLARRTTGTAAALLALGIVLTGCTGGAPTDAETPTAAATVPGLPPGVSQVTELPPDIPNDPETRANVQVNGCAATEDGWEATGTISNPGEEATTTVITVFFTTDKATVIGTAQTSVTVEPGDEQSWTAQDAFTAPTQTLCVLRGAGVAG